MRRHPNTCSIPPERSGDRDIETADAQSIEDLLVLLVRMLNGAWCEQRLPAAPSTTEPRIPFFTRSRADPHSLDRVEGHLRWLRGGGAGASFSDEFECVVAVPAGFEPATPRFEVSCSLQLSYGTVLRREKVFAFGPRLRDAHLIDRIAAR